MIDWIKYRDKYNAESPIEFENWLFEKFRKQFDNKKDIILSVQDLLHMDLWKNGHRNLTRIAQNNPIVIKGLPNDRKEVELRCIENLQSLLGKPGIQIRTASAILTFIRPDLYTVIDRFVVAAINTISRTCRTNFSAENLTARDYGEYLKCFWKLPSKFHELRTWTFRDIDKALMYYGRELLEK